MTGFDGIEIPRPTDWQRFERLCRDLWAEMWRDPSTQLNGRSGQAQKGVDIFGRPDEGTAWAGVQCKRTSAGDLDDRAITEAVLRAEVEKAKKFVPALQAEFVLATTAPRDATIQRIARTITDEHQQQGLFPVRVASWDDIQQHLGSHTKVWARHYADMVATVSRLSGSSVNASFRPEAAEPKSARARRPASEISLRDAAEALLEAAEPARIDLLFPDATYSVRTAIAGLSDVQRRATRVIAAGSREAQTPSVGLLDLAARGGRSLLLAPPGSGKTHALWHAAQTMLVDSTSVPVYVAGGRFESWQALEAHLADFGVDPRSLSADPRVVVCFDGWTEFGADGVNSHRDALRNFSRARVLATGRHSAQHDSRFELYALERLPVEAVRRAISSSFPTQPQPKGPLLELLTLPLALLLHLLVGGGTSTKGDMIARLHARLTEGQPEGFTRALAMASASTSLRSQQHEAGAFEAELRKAARESGIVDISERTKTMGTLGSDLRSPRPVHDLYWSWLVGVGLVESGAVLQGSPRLDLGESLELAAQSGIRPDPAVIDRLIPLDAELTQRVAGPAAPPELSAQVMSMLGNSDAAIQRRGVVAGLRSLDPVVFRASLQARTELTSRKFWFDVDGALDVPTLWHHRDEIASWSGDAGRLAEVLEAIAEHGDERWLPWLRRLSAAGRVSPELIGATALGCAQTVPDWLEPQLPKLFEKAWLLRPVAKRGTNTALARWTGAHYSDLLTDPQYSSRFVEVNRILVSCGDASVFAQLLDEFWSLPNKVRAQLSYAIVEKGEPWVSAFQKVAFSGAQPMPDVYKLYDLVSHNIDDETARHWIANGPASLGWRVLVRRHGRMILPELLAALPSSFSELNEIPPLRAMSDLVDPPDYLTDEIWKRTNGTLTPIATEDIIRALARVLRTGIPSLIGILRRNFHWLPNLGFNRFLLEYYNWERATGLSVRVEDATGTHDFGEWIRLVRWPKDCSDPLADHYMVNAELPVSDDVLSAWASGDYSLRRFVRISAPLRRYHAGAVRALLESDDGLQDLLKIFGPALDLFPEEVLQQVLAKAKSVQEFHSVLSAVASSNSAANRRFHAALLARLLREPRPDSYGSRQLARVLAIHSPSVLRGILGEGPCGDVTLWLVRDVEEIVRVRLVDERGQWLRP